MIKTIPLNKLVPSPRNVRKHADAAADAELKASIAASGLLQNLIVRAGPKGKFEVEAGERRRRALVALADDKVLPRTQPVTCLVLDETVSDAVETSLAENFHRLAMNPADEAQAFASLVEAGASSEEVARRFGLTVRFVEGRLRLANLAEPVLTALASGAITLDIAKAYGATSDQAIQARVYEQVSSAYYAPSPDSIRRMVLTGTVRGSDPRARFVGRDAYVEAGGRIERELFDDDDSESWVDVALLEELARAKMEEQAKALAAEHQIAWVRATLDNYVSHDVLEGLHRLPAEPAPLSEAELARLDELDKSFDEHAAILECEESAEEAIAAAEATIDAIGRETDEIRNRPLVLDPELRPDAGMILTLGRDGTPVLQQHYYTENAEVLAPEDDAVEVVSDGTGDARASWLGFVVARTFEASLNMTGDRAIALHDHLGSDIGIEIARWWRPTAANYFDRVSKSVILEALSEVGGSDLVARFAASKKGELAESAERAFSGNFITDAAVREAALGWVPEVMRFAAPVSDADDQKVDDDADEHASDAVPDDVVGDDDDNPREMAA